MTEQVAKSQRHVAGGRRVVLCDLLDRVLDRGVVLRAEIIISLAGVDLIYLGLDATLASAAALARVSMDAREEGGNRD